MVAMDVSSWRTGSYVLVQEAYDIAIALFLWGLVAAKDHLEMFVAMLQLLIFLLHAAIIEIDGW